MSSYNAPVTELKPACSISAHDIPDRGVPASTSWDSTVTGASSIQISFKLEAENTDEMKGDMSVNDIDEVKEAGVDFTAPVVPRVTVVSKLHVDETEKTSLSSDSSENEFNIYKPPHAHTNTHAITTAKNKHMRHLRRDSFDMFLMQVTEDEGGLTNRSDVSFTPTPRHHNKKKTMKLQNDFSDGVHSESQSTHKVVLTYDQKGFQSMVSTKDDGTPLTVHEISPCPSDHQTQRAPVEFVSYPFDMRERTGDSARLPPPPASIFDEKFISEQRSILRALHTLKKAFKDWDNYFWHLKRVTEARSRAELSVHLVPFDTMAELMATDRSDPVWEDKNVIAEILRSTIIALEEYMQHSDPTRELYTSKVIDSDLRRLDSAAVFYPLMSSSSLLEKGQSMTSQGSLSRQENKSLPKNIVNLNDKNITEAHTAIKEPHFKDGIEEYSNKDIPLVSPSSSILEKGQSLTSQGSRIHNKSVAKNIVNINEAPNSNVSEAYNAIKESLFKDNMEEYSNRDTCTSREYSGRDLLKGMSDSHTSTSPRSINIKQSVQLNIKQTETQAASQGELIHILSRNDQHADVALTPIPVTEKELEGREINKSEINKNYINNSKINNSEINNSEMNKSEINKSEINKSEINKSEIDNPEIDDIKEDDNDKQTAPLGTNSDRRGNSFEKKGDFLKESLMRSTKKDSGYIGTTETAAADIFPKKLLSLFQITDNDMSGPVKSYRLKGSKSGFTVREGSESEEDSKPKETNRSLESFGCIDARITLRKDKVSTPKQDAVYSVKIEYARTRAKRAQPHIPVEGVNIYGTANSLIGNTEEKKKSPTRRYNSMKSGVTSY